LILAPKTITTKAHEQIENEQVEDGTFDQFKQLEN
jgi:hypothetical protein